MSDDIDPSQIDTLSPQALNFTIATTTQLNALADKLKKAHEQTLQLIIKNAQLRLDALGPNRPSMHVSTFDYVGHYLLEEELGKMRLAIEKLSGRIPNAAADWQELLEQVLNYKDICPQIKQSQFPALSEALGDNPPTELRETLQTKLDTLKAEVNAKVWSATHDPSKTHDPSAKPKRSGHGPTKDGGFFGGF